jgi:hypothetical protein
MRTNLGMLLGLPRFGVVAALLGLLAFIGLSASSAKASVTWGSFGTAGTSIGTVNADTYDYYFSGATLTQSGGGGFTSQAGGVPSSGTFLQSASGAGMNGTSIILTLQNSTPVNLLSLNYIYALGGGFGVTTPSITWAYSVNGGGSSVLGSGFGYLSLSGIGPVGAGSTITFTGTLSGADGSTPSVGFDNFDIESVPEPVNYALAGFGLIFVVGSAGYTLRRKACAAKAA